MTINLTTAFSSTHWCGLVTIQVTQANSAVLVSAIENSPTASAMIMSSWLNGVTTEVLTDPSFWNSVGYGDQ
jgi:hypothetical protein